MRTEHDLRAALLTLEHNAPAVADVFRDDLVPVRSVHPPRMWLLAGLAATLVAAVAITASLFAADGQRPATHPGGRAVTDPEAVVDRSWHTINLTPAGTREIFAGVLHIGADGEFQADVSPCTSWLGTVRLTNGTATIERARAWDHSCLSPYPSRATQRAAQARQIRTIETILTGTIQWSIKHSDLIITKPGVGTITYGFSAYAPNSPAPTQVTPTTR